MVQTEVLVVGPASYRTGGIARYIAEQGAHLGDEFDLTVYDTGRVSGEGPVDFLLAVFGSLAALLRFPFRDRPDVVHVHTSHYFSFYRTAPYVLLAKYLWERPVLLHVHGSSFDEFVETAEPPVRQYQDLAFGASDRVVVLSEYWRDVLGRRVDDEKLVVLPNAIDVDAYDPDFGADPQHVVFVSNHIERKGIVDLVAAIDRVREATTTPFRVSIAGSGPLSSHAERLADRDDRTGYLGYVSEAEKRALLDAGSIYVLPTYGEGLPIALLEGMAGGNAVVTTTVGSIPEVIDAENGRVVDPGDVDALTEALADLVDAPETVTEMARTNYRLVSDEYDWDVVGQRLGAQYHDLLGTDTEPRAVPA